jgi:hypothetical protein
MIDTKAWAEKIAKSFFAGSALSTLTWRYWCQEDTRQRLDEWLSGIPIK